MRSINKVILIGNLTRNPETKEVQNGQKITTFSIATNRRWITSDSNEKTSTEYHDCVAWARLADICEKYLSKGKLIYIEGYLKTRSWTTEDGMKRFRTEVVVQDLIMLDKKGDSDDVNDEEDYVPEEDDAPNSDELPMDEAAEAYTSDENIF